VAFVLLAIVALLGFTMFARWIPTYLSTRRAPQHAADATVASAVAPVMTASAPTTVAGPAERHFPVPIVAGHGLLAATTLVLVIITLATS
jgi:hypothetical protein